MAPSGTERDAAQNFRIARGAEGGEGFGCRKRGIAQRVGDRDELVGIRALISAPADGGRDRVNRHGPVAIDDSGDVAEPVGGRRPGKSSASGSVIVSGWIYVSGRGIGYTYGRPRSSPFFNV